MLSPLARPLQMLPCYRGVSAVSSTSQPSQPPAEVDTDRLGTSTHTPSVYDQHTQAWTYRRGDTGTLCRLRPDCNRVYWCTAQLSAQPRAQPLPQPLMTIGPHEMTSRPRTVPPSTALGRIFFERDRYLHAVRPLHPVREACAGHATCCACQSSRRPTSGCQRSSWRSLPAPQPDSPWSTSLCGLVRLTPFHSP